MRNIYPEHLEGNAEDGSSRFPRDASEFHRYCQVVCQCGGRTFDLLVSDRRSVVAVCATCGSKILVYDLALYPAAVKIAGEETFGALKDGSFFPTAIFVMYEYGEPEPDVDFDRNDISWCRV